MSGIEYLSFFDIEIATTTSAGGEVLVAADPNASVTLTGGKGDDSLYGGKGNDTLIGGAGNDALDGQWGFNTAAFSGAFGDYVVTLDALTGVYTVSDKIAGRDGTDYAQSV